jgi:hypothetical protein
MILTYALTYALTYPRSASPSLAACLTPGDLSDISRRGVVPIGAYRVRTAVREVIGPHWSVFESGGLGTNVGSGCVLDAIIGATIDHMTEDE